MWLAAGLEEPGSRKAKARDGHSSVEMEGGEQVDNLAAGGFFGQYGCERTGAHPTVIPPFARQAATAVAPPLPRQMRCLQQR